MVELYIVTGLPGSGKSTWCRENAVKLNAVIINKDALRTMIRGEYFFDPKWEPLIHKFSVKMTTVSLLRGLNVIIDETNVTAERRRQWVSLAKSVISEVRVICVWCTENVNNLKNRENGLRGISLEKWAEVIEGMKVKFQEPSLSEGFNEIMRYSFKP